MRLYKIIPAVLFSLSVCSIANAAELCAAVADANNGKVIFERGECSQQVTPASTFKIAISLMGYDSGFLKDEHTPMLPYRQGYVDWNESWLHPTDPTKWIHDSVVWYSQQVTTSLGKERFTAYVKEFQYGNADVSGDAENDGLTMSWISSSLRISPLEQLSFLMRVVNRQLGVSKHAYDMTDVITKLEKSPDGWEIHGKTGAASGLGWYVGWASKKGRTFTFARLIRRDKSDPQDVSAGVLARDAFISEFPKVIDSFGH
ncbi:class D beta-lactamase [Rugamonas sp.]|uniref:class D beta-lactamase n=1 Tax=Rugamonas sp. TaxID=1926287 RepID=UPI0025EBB46C|nr:class D beta-lactamase [Rugamonas sp.]